MHVFIYLHLKQVWQLLYFCFFAQLSLVFLPTKSVVIASLSLSPSSSLPPSLSPLNLMSSLTILTEPRCGGGGRGIHGQIQRLQPSEPRERTYLEIRHRPLQRWKRLKHSDRALHCPSPWHLRLLRKCKTNWQDINFLFSSINKQREYF